jgi:hypothetical protein
MKKIKINRKWSFLLILLIFFYFIKKELVIVIIFTFFDFIKSIFKVKFKFVPIDLIYIFGVTASYFYNPFYSFLILIIGNFNRIAFGFFQSRHFSSSVRDIILFFISFFLKDFSFINVAIILIGLKYVLKFISDLVFLNKIFFEKFHFYIINIGTSLLIFYLINEISFILIS